MKLEDLERRLRADMLSEAGCWGGKVLLHREVHAPPSSVAAALAAAGAGGSGSLGGGGDEERKGEGSGEEDITRTTQFQPTTQVQAFWETSGDVGDIDQVWQGGGACVEGWDGCVMCWAVLWCAVVCCAVLC